MQARGVGRATAIVASVLGAVAIAFILVGRIDAQSVGGDEHTYLEAGLAYMRGDLSPNPEHPPLAKLVLGAWQSLVFEGAVAGRLLVAAMALGTASAIWWMLRGELGARAAIVPAVVVLVADHTVHGDRIDRLVTLEAFVVLGSAWAFAFAWRWRRGGGAGWLAASGAAMAAACLCKVSALVLVPAFLVLLVGPGRPGARRALVGIGLFAAAGIALAAAVLVPFGGVAAVQAMADYQLAHAQGGHAVRIDGVVHAAAPWWATLRFALDGTGIVPSIGIVLGAATAWLARPARALVATLTTATALSIVALSASPVALPQYLLGWIWMPTALAGVGLVELVRRVRVATSWTPRRIGAAAAAVVVGIGAAWSGTASFVRVALTERDAVDLAVETLLELDAEPVVYVPGHDGWNARAQEGVTVVGDPSAQGITAVIVGDDQRTTPDPALLAFLDDPDTCVGGLQVVEGWLVCDLGGELVVTEDGFAVAGG
ncbi:glycosyltransferase family 39 protein [Agrococcus sp. SGAir0287]|uniref:glycosyltransferase family 39 protein n=1 Tax=Agrococcus sp. SGAir0287 TaxID=2070347 RepID=UPI0010CCFAFD|nr:glycosyltransferase family 39 protein [Agrococcus sp. SGAir0287]QCR18678.1 hypothetical protein C1N71_03775 [Agrococcus sp. SGAir0287]